MMDRHQKQIYEFGLFRLDAAERLLWRDGETIPLQPKVFDLLLALVEHHGHLLEKDQLMKLVWSDTVVEEANLANNISILRKTLSENGQPLIETVPKRGYRFVADVREVVAENEKPETGAPATPANDPPEPTIGPPASLRRISWRQISWRTLAVALGVLLAAAGGVYKWRDSQRPAAITSIAVLPFKPLSRERRDEVLELGMADALITRLSNLNLEQMIVRSTNAVRKYTDLGQALALAPRYAIARQWHADNLQVMGRRDEAIAEMRLAQQLDPHSLPIARDVGRLLWFDGQYDQAIAELRKSFEIDSYYFPTHRYLGLAYASKGMYQEAIAELNQALSISGEHKQLIATRGYAYAMAGQRREARQAIDEINRLVRRRYVSPYEIATVHSALGDKDQAFAWLEKAYEERNTWMLHLKVDPRFESLRVDPRFAELTERVGLP